MNGSLRRKHIKPFCEVNVAIEFGATDAKQPAPRFTSADAAVSSQDPRARGNARAAARPQNPNALSERHVAAHAGNGTIPSAATERSIYSLTRRIGLTDRLPGKNHNGDNSNGSGQHVHIPHFI